MATVQKKTCFKCRKALPVDDFYKHPRMADGRLGKCKPCTRRDVVGNRQEKIDYYREYDRERARLPHRRENTNRVVKRYEATFPERKRAVCAVNNAVRNGRLIKQPCEVCGSRRWVHGHHDDYSKPLEVRWLCAAHHRQHHARLGWA